MNKTMLYSVILACLITVAGCGGGDDDNNSKAAGEITCSPTELTFIAAGGELPVNIFLAGHSRRGTALNCEMIAAIRAGLQGQSCLAAIGSKRLCETFTGIHDGPFTSF